MAFDGSEGTNAPFEIYIPYAQYRVYKKLINAPIYCEGAAKAHFSWHILSGGNAFDVFPAHIFKEKIAQFPAEEAGRMAKDFTRINFGWWAFYKDTQPDMFEYGTSRTAAWDCPITMMENIELFKSHPRTDDIFEVLRRWEDLRQKNLITQEMKEQLRNNAQEHILLINESQEYEMVPYDCIKNAANGNTDVSAFIFDRNCRSYVVCWHNTGSGYLSLPLSCKDVIYEAEIGGEKLAIEAGENSVTIPLTGRHYLSSSLPKEVLKEAFINAILLD